LNVSQVGTFTPYIALSELQIATLRMDMGELDYHLEGEDELLASAAEFLKECGAEFGEDGTCGIVCELLPEENKEGQKQYFLFVEDTGLTLVAHNFIQSIVDGDNGPDEMAFEYANTASRIVQDGFGGGAIIWRKGKEEISIDSYQWLRENMGATVYEVVTTEPVSWVDRVVSELNQGIKKFGEYSFEDKGLDAVMEPGAFLMELWEMEGTVAGQKLAELSKGGPNGMRAAEYFLGESDSMNDAWWADCNLNCEDVKY
jgi:hypothetical protein